MKKIEHLPVNWVNGLKLTNRHFYESYYNMIETARQTREELLTDYNYGFGDEIEKDTEPLVLDITGDTVDAVSIRLEVCNAVTREGVPIIYTSKLYGDHVPMTNLRDLEKENQNVYIIISIDPYHLLPVGVPDPEVTPLHHPYALPEIKLQVITASQMNKQFMEENCLIAGKGYIEDGMFILDKGFIPPVQRVRYHESLRRFHEVFVSHLDNIYKYTLEVYHKNVSDKRHNMLADHTFALCRSFQSFYCDHIFELKNLMQDLPPIHFLRQMSILAQRLITTLRIMPKNEHEMLLQYYNEWINVKPGELMENLGGLIAQSYSHTDIQASLTTIDNLIVMLEKLFRKMSELEYVGLMRENIVISDESDDNKSEKGKKSWTLID